MIRLILVAGALAGLSAAVWAQPSTAGQVQNAFSSNGDSRLDSLVREALERNPGISQGLARYRASRQRLPQVSALPDPMLGTTNYVRSPETRVGAQTNGVTLSQQLPWFGTRNAREQLAAKEAAIAREQYEAMKDQVVQQVKTAYYSLAFIDLALDINDEERLLLEHYEELAQSRYQQGSGLQQSVVKLQAEITQAQNRLVQLRSRRVDAEAGLNELRNLPPATAIPKVTLPPAPPATIDYSKLYQVGRNNRPEVLAALLGIERDEKRIEVAKKDYWPSFNLGASMINVEPRPLMPGAAAIDQNGKNIYSLNLGINLPVHRGKYDAEVAEATEQKAASAHGYQNTVNTIEASIREIGFRIESLREQISLFNNTLIPQAQQALQSAESAYSTGSLGVLDLLDSERVLLQVRLGLDQYITDYMKSLADMERAVGSPFPEVKP